MKKLRDYVFYRVYEGVWKKAHNVDGAVDSSIYALITYYLLMIEVLFFVAKGIIEFDMSSVTLFYLTHKKSIVLGIITVVLIGTYFMKRKYKKKVANGWIKELEAKYHKDSYCISTVWIVLFPFIMALGIPIIYGTITGIGEFWVPNR